MISFQLLQALDEYDECRIRLRCELVSELSKFQSFLENSLSSLRGQRKNGTIKQKNKNSRDHQTKRTIQLHNRSMFTSIAVRDLTERGADSQEQKNSNISIEQKQINPFSVQPVFRLCNNKYSLISLLYLRWLSSLKACWERRNIQDFAECWGNVRNLWGT